MTTTRRIDRRTAAANAALLATGAALLLASIQPALALCKHGGPNCADPRPQSRYEVKVNETRLPDSTWVDPDCAHYGNCSSPFPPAFAAQGGAPKPQPSLVVRRR